MKVPKSAAGLVDAGASSLSTFAVGVAATRLLTSAELGVYAMFFTALLFASQLPMQLILVPAEAQLLKTTAGTRYHHLVRNLALASPYGVVAALGVLAVQLLVPEGVSSLVRLQLAVTAAAVVVVEPAQQHARRLLHLARSHWGAAAISLARLGATGLGLVVGWALALDAALIPLGALAAGGIASVVVSLLLVEAGPHDLVEYHARDLTASGRWLLVAAALGPGSAFLGSMLVANLADPSALGLAEAARIVAQPVLVLAMGLAAVLRPGSMEAAVNRNQTTARLQTRHMVVGLSVVSVLYLGVLALPEAVNPLRLAVPKAFELSALAQFSVVAAFFNGVVFLQRAELIAVGKTRRLASAEAVASFGRALAALPAAAIRAWAVPLGFLIGGIARWITFSTALRKFYDANDLKAFDRDPQGSVRDGWRTSESGAPE